MFLRQCSTFLLSFFSPACLNAFDVTLYKKIVCFGDSITHGGHYHTFLQEYLAETDPVHPRQIINRGISGNTTVDLLNRVHKMLKTDKPDLVILMIGTNDLQFSAKFTEKDLDFAAAVKKYPVFNRFEKNLGDLLNIFNKAEVKVILLGTPPYNESVNPAITAPLNANLNTSGIRNLQVIEQRLAKQKGAVFIDIYTPMLKNLLENDAGFPRGKTDRIHPSESEHLLIAQTLLGKKYLPGPKQEAAEEYRRAQGEIQDLESYLARIPKSCRTIDAQIRFYRNWVAKLKGNDFSYWNKMLPLIIEFLKDPEAKFREAYQKRDAAFRKLYPK